MRLGTGDGWLDGTVYARDSPDSNRLISHQRFGRPFGFEQAYSASIRHQPAGTRTIPNGVVRETTNENTASSEISPTPTHIDNTLSSAFSQGRTARKKERNTNARYRPGKAHFPAACCRLRSSSARIILITSTRRFSTRAASSSRARRRSSYVANHSSRARSSSSLLACAIMHEFIARR